MPKGNLLTVDEMIAAGVPANIAKVLYQKQVATAPKEHTYKVKLTEEQEAAFKKQFPNITLVPAFKSKKSAGK